VVICGDDKTDNDGVDVGGKEVPGCPGSNPLGTLISKGVENRLVYGKDRNKVPRDEISSFHPRRINYSDERKDKKMEVRDKGPDNGMSHALSRPCDQR
jgi:hypothetical protein